MKTNQLKFKLIKTDAGEFYNKDLKKLNRALDRLEPGIYNITIDETSDLLSRMRAYYFVMEERLSQHLGMSKDAIHKETKTVFLDSKGEYDSVAKIKTEDAMMARITQFQIWSANEFNYTQEPFTDS